MTPEKPRQLFKDSKVGEEWFFRRLRKSEFSAQISRFCDKICPLRGEEYLNSHFKRKFDLFCAALTTPLVTPSLLGAIVAIKTADLRSPVFFTQSRYGKGGKEFQILKLRTMIPGAEGADPERAKVVEKRGDPRITKVGRFIRKLTIDEFPQLVNIFRGEMSFIGVRPTNSAQAEGIREHILKSNNYSPKDKEVLLQCHQKWLVLYTKGKPSLLGLSQVSGRADLLPTKFFRYDNFYVEHASLALDLLILIRGLWTVPTMKGAE